MSGYISSIACGVISFSGRFHLGKEHTQEGEEAQDGSSVAVRKPDGTMTASGGLWLHAESIIIANISFIFILHYPKHPNLAAFHGRITLSLANHP